MAFGNKNSTPSFVLTLPMKVTEQDEIFLSKKFRVGCTVYNQMVTKTTKMWHQLRKTREYKTLVKAIKAAPANSDKRKALLVQHFDYIVYGKRLASKSENTVEFVENTIVSHNKQELEVVASGMEAMGLSVETGYYDPDDESSVDMPKQLIGFHYVVLKKNTL